MAVIASKVRVKGWSRLITYQLKISRVSCAGKDWWGSGMTPLPSAALEVVARTLARAPQIERSS
jgi:hypothetical protein